MEIKLERVSPHIAQISISAQGTGSDRGLGIGLHHNEANEGEPFDPNVHEAVSLIQSAGVTEPTCIQILQPGYMVGDRIVRPARVIVAEPDDAGPGAVEADQLDEAGLPDPDEPGPQENREDED